MASSVEIVLAALYLRGAPRAVEVPRRGWPALAAALRREPVGLGGCARVLRAAGAELPAIVLESEGLLAWAEEIVEREAALTVVTEGYPLRWFEAFGDLAPPALWRTGPAIEVRWIGAVGSREIETDVAAFMRGIGEATVGLGYGLVSGGALGCDAEAENAALRSGGTVLRLLPHGIALRERDDATHLALAAPNEPFSRQLAMERNALIYGAAEATVVGHARLRTGGTWHGASEALRRHLGQVLVRDDGSPAFRALVNLGAGAIGEAAELAEKLRQPPSNQALFAYERRRRRTGI